jgi:hypothetical protein
MGDYGGPLVVLTVVAMGLSIPHHNKLAAGEIRGLRILASKQLNELAVTQHARMNIETQWAQVPRLSTSRDLLQSCGYYR